MPRKEILEDYYFNSLEEEQAFFEKNPHLLNPELTQPITTTKKKTWKISSKTRVTRKLIKMVILPNRGTRLVLPKALIDAYNITQEHHAYINVYVAKGEIKILLSKRDIPDADYERRLNPVGTGLYYIAIPKELTNRLELEEFPDKIWIEPSPESDENLVELEVWPA